MDIQLKKKPWYIRYLSYVLAVTALIGIMVYVCILALGSRKLDIESDEYRIVEAAEIPFMEYLDVEGIVHPIQTIQINVLESGFVESIVAEEGSMLEAGDTILVLSNLDLLRDIEDGQAEWQNQLRNYQEQEIEMEQRSITLRQLALDAEHQLSSLEKSMEQSREEFRMGIKSKAELEVAEEDYLYQHKRAQLQIQSLRHDSVATLLKRDMIRADREASLLKLARTSDRTDNLVVRAPVAGQLSFLKVALGQQVAAGSGIGEIKVMTEYKIQVSLSEYYIDRIVSGLSANIQYQDNKYPLRISKVVPEVKDRNFTCDLIFSSEKPSNIRIGKSYRVQIELAKPEMALVIPRGDFYQATSGDWIYRISHDGKTARKTQIEIGRQNPQQYEIISGLQPGDRVIVNGYEKLGEVEELVIK